MPANFIWICTATPEEIKTGKNGTYKTTRYITNWLIKNAFFFANDNYPELTEKYVVKLPDEYIVNFTSIPPPKIINIVCKKPLSISLTQGIIEEDILQMIKNDQINEAIERLDEGGTNIYDASLNKLNKNLHILELELNTMKLKNSREETIENKQKEINETKKKIEDLNFRKERIQENLNDNECAICFTEMVNITEVTCCSKICCFICIARSIQIKCECPFCRQRISKNNLKSIKTDRENTKAVENISQNKFTSLQNILINTNKVLLYIRSYRQFEGTDNYEEKILDIVKEAGLIAVVVKKLDKKNINNFISDFRITEQRTCWIMESETSSAGLNFEFVDSIITYEKYKSERQIMYRGLRPGRTTNLNFYRLSYDDEHM
jgi:hypothetical protein